MEFLTAPIEKVNGLLSHSECLSRCQTIDFLVPEAQATDYQAYDENDDCLVHLVLSWYLTKAD